MDVITLLAPERIACEAEISSKKRAFERLAAMLASEEEGLGAAEIFDALTNREKLGCTAIGNGAAIPHACMSVRRPRGALLLMEEGIKMDAPDRKPVQLFMAILVPGNSAPDYSDLITQLTGTLLQKSLIEHICNQRDPVAMLEQFCSLFNPPGSPFMGAMAA